MAVLGYAWPIVTSYKAAFVPWLGLRQGRVATRSVVKALTWE